MTWYAAHLIMRVKFKDRDRTPISIWENIVLVQADSDEEAFRKASQRGQEGEGDSDGTFRWDGHPAEWVFAGVRKLTLCEDKNRRPGDGTEVSYLEMEVSSEDRLRKLVAGAPTSVKLVDQFPDQVLETVGPASREKSRTKINHSLRSH
jgi:hypothetical protein